MYLFQFQPTLKFVVAILLIRVNALPQSTHPSLAQRNPTESRNARMLELDGILVGSKISPPTGKVTLTKADVKWNTDNKWEVYEVEGLVDKNGKQMTETVTATTRVDGGEIDLELIDKDALLGYGYDKGEGLNRRWWVLESKIPPDISQTEVLEISKLFYEHGSVPMPFYHSASFEAFRSADDGEYIYFTMPNIVMYPYRGCAFTRINGGRVDKEVRDSFLRDESGMGHEIIYGFEEMYEPYRRRWWLVYACGDLE